MAGGSGTRFWPLSRRHRPKQFLPIGTDSPLIVETVERLAPLVPTHRIRIVAGEHHVESIRTHLPALDARSVLVEPCARNTAPCIGLAAIHVAHKDPNAVMAVLPSDHHIGDGVGFRRLLQAASERALQGEIVTLGITPTRPETGYGYIKLASDEIPLSTGMGVSVETVDRFVEKPDLETAKSYISSGRYLWNSGMFFFTARNILTAFERHLPELSQILDRIAAAIGTPGYDAVLSAAFADADSISLDYGIMEPITQGDDPTPVRVIAADIGWNDVGHWAALADFAETDDSGNVIAGDALVIDGRENIVHSEEGLVALVGISDTVVVRTGDAVLVCRRDDAQDVRKIVDALRDAQREDLL
jgi:mannose-1-phosphate guanylyltransferase